MNLFEQVYCWFVNETSTLIKSLTLPIILGSMYKLFKFIYEKLSDRKDKANLFPYYTLSTIRNSKRNYIKTKCQNVDPSNELNYKSSFAFSAKEDLLDFFLKKVLRNKRNENQFYLILGDSGMGKTTFMLNLFSRYTSVLSILNKKEIRLLPLGEKFENILDEIEKIKLPAKTILLLDAFDELPALDTNNILPLFHDLIDKTKSFKHVIITCRTHFFSSEKEEPFELKVKRYDTNGNKYLTIPKMYVSPFDDNDIKKYIDKVYKFYEAKKKKKAYQVVSKTHDLMVRPMLLSYIKEIVDSNDVSLKNSFDIYESLIVSWFERESKKYEIEKRFEFRLNLIHFTYAIVNFIYENYEKNGLFVPLEDALQISNLFEINLNEIEIKSRSLLNRNALGHYKFSHKSFLEFFIAFLAFQDREYNNDTYQIKYDLKNFDFAKKLMEDIVCNHKTNFRLPLINNAKQDFDKDQYRRVLIAKTKNSTAKIEWISESSFKVGTTKE